MEKNIKILVVDDQAFMFSMIQKIFKDNGYSNIEYAPNGLKAIEMDKANNYDLITLDITMPELNGIEAAKKIFEIHPDKKILMVSAMGQESIIREAITVGVRNFLLKPFTPDKFVEKLNKTLI
ncbi:MAG: response regulator [bacterium]